MEVWEIQLNSEFFVNITYLMVGLYQLFQWVNGVYQSPSHELKYQGSPVHLREVSLIWGTGP